MAKQLILPVLPLRGLTVFPMMVLHLDVGRDRSVQALDQAMLMDDNLILLVAQKDVNIEDPVPQDLYDIGTIARIKQMLKMPNGSVRVLVEGIERGRIIDFVSAEQDEYCQVKIKKIKSKKIKKDSNADALARSVLTCFEQYCNLSNRITGDICTIIGDIDEPGNLADLIAAHLPLKILQKQMILETEDIASRLEKLLLFLNNETEMLELEHNIVKRVKGQIEKTQKEYYLREQIKAIQHELGDKDGNMAECEQFRLRLQDLGAPDNVVSKLNTEIDRLEKMSANSAESGVIRAYVECVLDLPWKKETENKSYSLQEAEKILNEDNYGLDKTKERILEHLAVEQRSPQIKGPILCFVGPPGVGKTSIAKSIAKACGRKFVRVSLGGVRDEADIRGHRRTYIGAMPGRIMQGIRACGSATPVVLLDEIDKMVVDFKGDPSAALLEVLDSSQNTKFIDHYVDAEFDLSGVMFIATANTLYNMSRPLLDRMEVVSVSGYTELEKEQIARRHLLPRQMEHHGLQGRELSVYKDAIMEIIRNHTCEAGVRELNRMLGTLCRKAVKKISSGYNRKIVITERKITDFLGKSKYHYGKSEQSDQVGLSMGLAWTEYGGDVLPVEVSVCPGKGALTLTGQLGEVMQESAKAAVSYIRSRAEQLKISINFTEEYDIHIHFPEGSIPKDGPSAGTAIATALVSALTGRPVSCQVAMTGEITLRGRVLGIGGLKEKSLSAHRAGIKEVLYPAENEVDLVDIPISIREQLNFISVKHMDEVLQKALVEESCASI